jgi:hypothetical protein
LTWNDLFGETNTKLEESVQQPQAKREFPEIHRKIGQQATEPKNEEFPEIDSQTSQGFNFKPDWIDISATSLGYEKHPLEQILEWLDQSILWIEQIFTNMIYFFRGLLLGR